MLTVGLTNLNLPYLHLGKTPNNFLLIMFNLVLNNRRSSTSFRFDQHVWHCSDFSNLIDTVQIPSTLFELFHIKSVSIFQNFSTLFSTCRRSVWLNNQICLSIFENFTASVVFKCLWVFFWEESICKGSFGKSKGVKVFLLWFLEFQRFCTML